MYERFQGIKVRIIDQAFLIGLPRENVKRYLLSCGFEEKMSLKNFSIWENENAHAINFPASAGYTDYGLRMAEMLEKLEETEGKNQLDIVEEIYQA